MTRVLFEAFDTHYISATHLRGSNALASPDDLMEEEEYSWTLTTALFFTATLLTTIGKGRPEDIYLAWLIKYTWFRLWQSGTSDIPRTYVLHYLCSLWCTANTHHCCWYRQIPQWKYCLSVRKVRGMPKLLKGIGRFLQLRKGLQWLEKVNTKTATFIELHKWEYMQVYYAGIQKREKCTKRRRRGLLHQWWVK